MHIADTKGQYRSRTFTPAFFKDQHGIILLYDVTYKDFSNESNWIKQIVSDSKAIIVLVGNKDDEKKRKISEEEGKTLAEKYNIGFFEISINSGQNVKEVFEYLIEKNIEIYEKKNGIKIENIKDDKKNEKKKCVK